MQSARQRARPSARAGGQALTPEEDAIDFPDDEDDEIDDLLPADLWFRRRCHEGRCHGRRGQARVVYFPR